MNFSSGKRVKKISFLIGMILILLKPEVGLTQSYFIGFTNKVGSEQLITHPQSFLSDRAIERRAKQSILIDETDLPLSSIFCDSLVKLGIQIQHKLKWVNGVVATSANQLLMDTLTRLSFVELVELTKPAQQKSTLSKWSKSETYPLKNSLFNTTYGDAFMQINTINGIPLHNLGFKGDNMQIAIIDAGFYKVNELPLFSNLFSNNQLLGTHDFVNPQSDIFMEHTHGMQVLSVIGGYQENFFMGTAPDARFWLLRSEDNASEYPIEADNWIAAAEFADSVGVDIINTSLGYSLFSDPQFNYTYNQTNSSTRISTAASLASQKGLIVVVSAGNEGHNVWKYITMPSDAKGVMTVGAMSPDSLIAVFSGIGPTSDGRVKPDIVAMGINVANQNSSGTLSFNGGTSFSAPLVSGICACLWQALPNLKATDIVDLIKKSSNHYTSPLAQWGYGIPNFNKALESGIALSNNGKKIGNWSISPNPFVDYINMNSNQVLNTKSIRVELYASNGQLILNKNLYNKPYSLKNIGYLPSGLYVLKITQAGNIYTQKVIK